MYGQLSASKVLKLIIETLPRISFEPISRDEYAPASNVMTSRKAVPPTTSMNLAETSDGRSLARQKTAKPEQERTDHDLSPSTSLPFLPKPHDLTRHANTAMAQPLRGCNLAEFYQQYAR